MNLRRAALAVLLCAPWPALAWDNFKSRFTDGPSLGVLAGGDLDQTRVGMGWQAGYDLNRPVSLELSYLTWEDEINSSTLEPIGLPAGSKINLDNHSFALTLRWHLTRHETWSSFVGGGASYFLANEEDKQANRRIFDTGSRAPSSVDVELENGFAPHLIAGAEVSLSKHWEVFGEARLVAAEYDLNTRLDTRREDGSVTSRKVRESYGYDHTLFRVGVNYRF